MSSTSVGCVGEVVEHFNAMQGVMNGTLRPSKPKDCDPAWSSIMEKCWATQPSKRATFTDVADALDALVAKCDAESQQPPPSPAMLKSSLRNSDGTR